MTLRRARREYGLPGALTALTLCSGGMCLPLQPPTERQLVAFVAGDAYGKRHLYVTSVDGRGLRQLTRSGGDCSDPIWSRDGQRIAFSMNGWVFAVGRGGDGMRRLARGYTHGILPDGRLLIRGPKEYGPFAVPFTGGKPTRVPRWWDGGWSPDGSRVAYYRHVEPPPNSASESWSVLELRKREGGHATRVTPFGGESSYDIEWSPNGRWVAFVFQPHGYQVYLADAAGRGLRLIAGNEGMQDYGGLAWSPDSKRLAYVGSKETTGPRITSPSSYRQLYLMNADGSGKKRLTNFWGDSYNPQWTRDGRYLVFQSARQVRVGPGFVYGSQTTGIYAMSADGKQERMLSKGLRDACNQAVSP